MQCESCGLPDWAVTVGINICLYLSATKSIKSKSAKRKTVWVCSPTCALCARAVAVMGQSSRLWPMTLAEFARMPSDTGLYADPAKLVPKDGLTVTLTDDNSQRLQGSQRGKKKKVNPYPQKQVKAPTAVKSGPRRGGRPRVENPLSPAQRMRAYRQRISQTPTQATAD